MTLVPGQQLIVRKVHWQTGEELGSWTGVLAAAHPTHFEVHGFFTNPRGRQHVSVDGVDLVTGDRFTEFYYLGRWFNVFHIADYNGRRKGWYCNIARPAQPDALGISFVDLYLDLFVHPNGRYTVLDEDELAAANLPAELKQQAYDGLKGLIALVESGSLPGA